LQAVAEAVAPELGLVEEEASGVEEQVPADGPAGPDEGGSDLPDRLPDGGMRAEELRVLFEGGQGGHRPDPAGGTFPELRDAVEGDEVGLPVEMHLVVRQQVGPSGEEIEGPGKATGEFDGLLDGLGPVQLEGIEVHA